MSALPIKKPYSILVVDDEPGIRDFLTRALEREYSLVTAAESAEQAAKLSQQQHFDLLIVDICMPGQSGIEWLSTLDQAAPSAVIVMTGYAELDSAIDSLRLGASDFIHKPFRLEQMLTSVQRAFQQLSLSRENVVLRRRLFGENKNIRLVGSSRAIKELTQLIQRVAPLPSAVLIEGETGTGKELVASALHELSDRSGNFVPINCGAISSELIESELFGHVKGAYTGAGQSREGLFSHADGGTLFLDEIAEMPLGLQAKLLRVLEENKVRPVGSEQTYDVNVRIVAACNRSLKQSVTEGKFREDLYYRLNVLPLQLPPLRQRTEDVPELASYFNERLAKELGVGLLPLSHQDYSAMQKYGWPGNVRELRNIIERCMLLNTLPTQLLDVKESSQSLNQGYPADWNLGQVEMDHMQKVIDACAGNKKNAAQQLGVSSKTLQRRFPNNG